MKKLLIITLLSGLAIGGEAQDTIIFNNNPTPVICKIRDITPNIIFYIHNGEYLSDFMSNVKYHSKFVPATTADSKKSTNILKEQPEQTQNITINVNQEAERLTRQCLHLHIASVGLGVMGIVLTTAGATSETTTTTGTSSTSPLIYVGVAFAGAAGICGIIEWIDVGTAHSLLSIGNKKVSFNANNNGIGIAYNFNH